MRKQDAEEKVKFLLKDASSFIEEEALALLATVDTENFNDDWNLPKEILTAAIIRKSEMYSSRTNLVKKLVSAKVKKEGVNLSQ